MLGFLNDYRTIFTAVIGFYITEKDLGEVTQRVFDI
jgi:aldehyde:ferredoxin oxidoreductase